MKLRALFPLLALGGLATALATTTAQAGGYSPQALADVKEKCTTKGTLSTVCVEFFEDVVVGDNKLKIDSSLDQSLRNCFADAKRDEKYGTQSSSGREALDVLRKREAGEPGAKNKYVDECIRVTTAMLGEEWRTAAMTAAFDDRVAKTLRTDFEKKCGEGARADLQHKGDPFTIVLWNRSNSKAVVFEGTDPHGMTLSVLCNGYIVGKTKAGKAFSIPPTMIGDVRKAEKQGCVSHCRTTHEVCREGFRRGKTTPACDAFCNDKCR